MILIILKHEFIMITPFLYNSHQDGFVNRFVDWATEAEEPLKSYATGLLAAAVEVQDIAGNLKDINARLVRIPLKDI